MSLKLSRTEQCVTFLRTKPLCGTNSQKFNNLYSPLLIYQSTHRAPQTLEHSFHSENTTHKKHDPRYI